MKRLLYGVLLLACALATLAQTALSDAPRVHDPSTIIAHNGEYWFYSTGPGIRSWHSKDLQHWTNAGPVLRPASEWTRTAVPGNRGFLWAPDIIRSGDGKRFWLYYSVSTWGKNTSAIGLASNETLDPVDPRYRWNDEGIVVQSHATNQFNAIDPSVFRDVDGRLWLTFGSFWRGIMLTELDRNTGRRLAAGERHWLARNESIEAPFLTRHGDYYYLFVNWGLCCRGTNSTYNIRVGRSRSVTGPYVDHTGKDMREGGGKFVLANGAFGIGAGHASILNVSGTNWLSCHVYVGGRNDESRLKLFRLDWDQQQWPLVRDSN